MLLFLLRLLLLKLLQLLLFLLLPCRTIPAEVATVVADVVVVIAAGLL